MIILWVYNTAEVPPLILERITSCDKVLMFPSRNHCILSFDGLISLTENEVDPHYQKGVVTYILVLLVDHFWGAQQRYSGSLPLGINHSTHLLAHSTLAHRILMVCEPQILTCRS